MKFKIRESEPTESTEPETEAWLDIDTDGALRLRVENKNGDVRSVLSLEPNGTFYRYTGLEGLGFQVDPDGRITERED